jgi:hypothetical protein
MDKQWEQQLLNMDAGAERVRFWRELEREQKAERDRPKADPLTGMQPGRLTDIIR